MSLINSISAYAFPPGYQVTRNMKPHDSGEQIFGTLIGKLTDEADKSAADRMKDQPIGK